MSKPTVVQKKGKLPRLDGGETSKAKAPKVVVSAKAPKVVEKPAKEKVERKPTVSSTARELILKGKTNEEVLEALVDLFQLDPETKKHYPGWYRAQLVRKGELTKEQAAATRH